MVAGLGFGSFLILIAQLDDDLVFVPLAIARTVMLGTAYIYAVPVSTTHVITSSVMGVGATRRLSAVRWGVASNIAAAWVLTIPAAGLVAAVVYFFSAAIV